MKYTKKDIIKGFKKWEKNFRLTPSNFSTTEEDLKEDLDKVAKDKAKALINFINK